MKIRTATIVTLAVAAALGVFASTGIAATPHKTVAFTGSYSGTVAVNQTDTIANLLASGTGSGTLIGAGKIAGSGKGDTSVQPCVPFSGPGSLSGTGGKVSFTVVSGATGCGDEAGQIFSVAGKAKVTSATGKLKKATGTLKFTGVYDRGAGTFSVKFKGNLTI